jgi:hypothetical protein
LLDLQLQDVEPVRGAWYSSEHMQLLVTDLQCSKLEVDAASTLLELPKANYISPESRNVVHSGQPPMIAAFAEEEDGALPFDLNNRAISELHRTTNPEVKL